MDKEHKQELLSLPAAVPQTVYRYCGHKALLAVKSLAGELLSINTDKVKH